MQDERISQLCSQLVRAENAGVIETAARRLQKEINEYMREANCEKTPINVFSSPERKALS